MNHRKLLRCIVMSVVITIITMIHAAAGYSYDSVSTELTVKTTTPCVVEITGDMTETKEVDGDGVFVLTASEPGTYRYRIKQIPGSDENVTYDTTEYNVLLFVESVDDRLLTAITLYFDDVLEKPAEVKFTNTVKTDPTTSTPPTATPSTKPGTPTSERPTSTTPQTTTKTSTQRSNTTSASSGTTSLLSGVRTGNTNRVVILACLLIAILACAGFLIVYKYKKRNCSKE